MGGPIHTATLAPPNLAKIYNRLVLLFMDLVLTAQRNSESFGNLTLQYFSMRAWWACLLALHALLKLDQLVHAVDHLLYQLHLQSSFVPVTVRGSTKKGGALASPSEKFYRRGETEKEYTCKIYDS